MYGYQQPGKYSFTRKHGMLIKLPVGKPAVIVGISMQHDSLFFASSKIIIKDGYSVQLPMKYTSINSLNDFLIAALK